MKALHMIAYLLLFVGGLNWGLIGLFNFNLVNSLLSTMPVVEQAVYLLVGVSTVYIIATLRTDSKVFSGK
ncbi:MAG TPA: DUF378 domain-containing protein [Patescibacteria group bacterium]|nr:DUF378 domain-containing protein [Patescibacteria group bacterium]